MLSTRKYDQIATDLRHQSDALVKLAIAFQETGNDVVFKNLYNRSKVLTEAADRLDAAISIDLNAIVKAADGSAAATLEAAIGRTDQSSTTSITDLDRSFILAELERLSEWADEEIEEYENICQVGSYVTVISNEFDKKDPDTRFVAEACKRLLSIVKSIDLVSEREGPPSTRVINALVKRL
jgi:predicted metal-dependent phosphoesterase TrpH